MNRRRFIKDSSLVGAALGSRRFPNQLARLPPMIELASDSSAGGMGRVRWESNAPYTFQGKDGLGQ